LNHDKYGGNDNQNQKNPHFDHPPFCAGVQYTNGRQTKRAARSSTRDFMAPSSGLSGASASLYQAFWPDLSRSSRPDLDARTERTSPA
jgi:hypothetical protein